MKTILLTFDVEEFDLPLEFGKQIEKEKQLDISKKGLDNLLSILKKHKVKATFFTTLEFAKNFPSLMKEMEKEGHEIASHGYYHSDNYKKDLSPIKKAKEAKEKLGLQIHGFRAPRFQIKEIHKLHEIGFKYDSSIHPTWIPGRYFNLFKKRKIHKIQNIEEIPLSTLPIFRLPIFWIAFKNFPLTYSKIFTKLNFLSSRYTMLYFHPWEFTNIKEFNLPKYIQKNSLKKLEDYIIFCKNNDYKFLTIKDYLI